MCFCAHNSYKVVATIDDLTDNKRKGFLRTSPSLVSTNHKQTLFVSPLFC